MLLKSCWTMSKQGAILYVPPYRANLTGLPSRRIDSQDCESKPIARELHLWFRSKSTGLPAWNKSVKSLDCNFTAKSSVHSCHLLTSIPILWAQVQESRIKEIRLTTIRAQQSQAMEGVNAIFGLQDQNEALQSGPHKLVVPQKIGGEGRRWVFQKKAQLTGMTGTVTRQVCGTRIFERVHTLIAYFKYYLSRQHMM